MLSIVARKAARGRSSASAMLSFLARANQHEHPQAIRKLILQRCQSTGTAARRDTTLASFMNQQSDSAFSSISSSTQPSLTPRQVEQQFIELDTFVRKFGRMNRNDFDQAFRALAGLKDANLPIPQTQFLMLVRCCGSLMCEETPAVRQELVSQVWSTFSASTKLDISHYNALLKVHCDNESRVDPSSILSEIESHNLIPNRVTYQRLIHLYCQRGDMEGATKILEIMKSKDVPINENVFNSLILGYGRAGDLESTDATLKAMRQSGIEPSSDTYTSVISAYAERVALSEDNADKIRSLLNEAANDEAILTPENYFTIITSLAKSSETSPLIDELINSTPRGMGYNQDAYKAVLNLVCHKSVNTAVKVLKTMTPTQAQRERKFAGSFMIRQMVKVGIPPVQVIQLCRELEEADLNEHGIRCATYHAFQFEHHSVARVYLSHLAEQDGVRPHYFWPLIARSTPENMVTIVLEDLPQALGLYSPMHDTFAEWIWPRVKGDPFAFMDKCRQVGYTYSLLLSTYIDHKLANHDVTEALETITNRQYERVKLQNNVILRRLALESPHLEPSKIATIVDCLTRKADSLSDPEESQEDWIGRYLLYLYEKQSASFMDHFSRLKPEFLNRHLFLSSELAERLSSKTRISEAHAKEIATLVSDTPRDVERVTIFRREESEDYEDRVRNDDRPRTRRSIEDLERLLEEQRSRQQDTTQTLATLLVTYCRVPRRTSSSSEIKDNAEQRVEELLQEYQKSGQQLSPGALTSLMDFYSLKGQIEKALEYKSKIPPEFNVDSYKILDFAAALTKAGRLQDGLSLIREGLEKRSGASVREESDEDERLVVAESQHMSPTRSANRFLNAVIEATKDANAVKDALKLVLEYTSQRPNALILNCLVKVHLQNDDVEKAVDEFCNCCEAYRSSPYRNELMKLLLQKQDGQNLQRVIDANQSLYGEHSTLFHLAIACVESGKLKQAKKVLETPGLQINPVRLETICQEYVNLEKAKEFEDLISVTRKSVHDFDRDTMYYHLLRLYAKSNDAQKALNAWTTMQEENMQISGRNMRLIAQILQKNGMEPPFEVPEEGAVEAEMRRDQGEREGTLRTRDRGQREDKFGDAIRNNDLSTALELKEKLERDGRGITLAQYSLLIEALLKNDRLKEAYAMTQKLLIERHFPSPRTVRFLLSKLASAGDLEALHNLREYIPASISETPAFTSLLTNAYINAGRLDEFMEKVLPNISPFPVGGVLAILNERPDLEEKVKSMAKAKAIEEDFIQPLNMVWVHYMMNGEFAKAREIFHSNPKFKEKLLFNAIIEKIRNDRDLKLAQELVNQVKTSNLTPRAVGLTYSALLEALIQHKQYDKAEEILLDEITHGGLTRTDVSTGRKEPLLTLSDLNRRTLIELQEGIRRNLGRDARFQLPERNANRESDADLSDLEINTAKRPA